jgi:uncharacterized membrane protein YsdA (DUF1294 family)
LKIFIIYLIIINLACLFLMAQDKKFAKQGHRRIPEKRLFLNAVLGGALGIWLGMKLWHHKTKHRSFTIGIPALFIINIISVYLIVKWLYI